MRLRDLMVGQRFRFQCPEYSDGQNVYEYRGNGWYSGGDGTGGPWHGPDVEVLGYPLNARFWVWHGGWVKLTLREGQSVSVEQGALRMRGIRSPLIGGGMTMASSTTAVASWVVTAMGAASGVA